MNEVDKAHHLAKEELMDDGAGILVLAMVAGGFLLLYASGSGRRPIAPVQLHDDDHGTEQTGQGCGLAGLAMTVALLTALYLVYAILSGR